MPTPIARRLSSFRPALAALASALVLAACGDAATAPGPAVDPARPAALPPGTATARWNEVARNLVMKHRPNNPAAFRLFAYLTQAQLAAVASAEREGRSVAGALAGASATVLAYTFPAEARALDSIARAEERLPVVTSLPDAAPQLESSLAFAGGEAIGREAGAHVVARAVSDQFDAAFTGQAPIGPGYWGGGKPSPTAPLMPALGRMRPFALATGSQFRPPPPPAFGSPAFLADLEEVRQVARTRTAEQTRIAQAWALPPGTMLPAGYWNVVALELAARHGLGERETARVLSLVNAAMMDVTIAVHDAKYTYWYVRPSQADTTITLAIGMPSHPSYPSNHTAASVAAAEVLRDFFPKEGARVDSLATEAGLSRLYAGIHYRFDIDAGAELGRAVARATLLTGRRGAALPIVP